MERILRPVSAALKRLCPLLGLVIPALMMQSACSQETYLSFGTDQHTAHPFEETDRIHIIMGEKSEQGLLSVDHPSQIPVTIRFAFENAVALEFVDVVALSGHCFGQVRSADIADYRLDPQSGVDEIQFRTRAPCTRRTLGLGHEVVVMVKLKTVEGKYYYALKQLKVEHPSDFYPSH